MKDKEGIKGCYCLITAVGEYLGYGKYPPINVYGCAAKIGLDNSVACRIIKAADLNRGYVQKLPDSDKLNKKFLKLLGND
jgi:hypothetical protein